MYIFLAQIGALETMQYWVYAFLPYTLPHFDQL